MTVYVDDMFMPAKVSHRGRSVSGRWCHMFADSRAELDEMAERVGMRREWIQNPGTHKEHYDVTEPRRKAAIEAGAKVLPIGPQWVRFMNQRKAAMQQRAQLSGE